MTTTTPNMNLVLPDVSVTAGPEWATLLNAAFSVIDLHDHSTNEGVRITPSGLNISSDLSFGQNNATNLRTARLYNNTSFTPGVNDKTCLYSLNNELYYRDGNGNTVQLTLDGAVDISGSILALTVKDTGFTIQNFSDNTKQMNFNLSAIPTATTRILSVPDSGANDSFITSNATQTLTNKTIPIIGTGSVNFTLPTTDGTGGQVLATNGSAVLSFVPSATSIGDVAANDSNVVFTNTSNRVQVSLPTAARTYTLPTAGISAGDTWTFVNRATTDGFGTTLQSSAANTIAVIPPSGSMTVIALINTPTSSAHWLVQERHSQWTAFTPTMTGMGTVTGNVAYYRLNQNNLQVRGSFASGSPTAVLFTITVPTQFPINTTYLSQNNIELDPGNIVGQIGTDDTTSGKGASWIITCPATSVTRVYSGTNFADATANSKIRCQNATVITSLSTTVVAYQFEVPIA